MISFARRHVRGVLVLAVLVAVLVPAGLWLRTSELVGVRTVEISGVQGSQSTRIHKALTAAGLDMTTLAVDEDALRDAVTAFPIVRSLRTSTEFPHGLRIDVNVYEPVAALAAGESTIAVGSDGTLLRGASRRGLPLVGVRQMPGGARVSDADALRAIRLLAAAPAPLRLRIERVFRGQRGLSATLDNGPKLYFGGDDRARAKWAAAAEVLAQPSSHGASYVDVRLPGKPVAGGFQPRPGEA